MVPLLSDDGLRRVGHTHEFAEYINAVMYEKTLDHEARFSLACRVQVERTSCHPVGPVATFIDHVLQGHSLPGAKMHQYIESVGYLAR